MTKIITILQYTLPALLLFAVLFDPSEVAIGSSVIDLPVFMISIAEMIGNTIWISRESYCPRHLCS